MGLLDINKETNCLKKNDYPLVSVIIPFYNNEFNVSKCINSILTQEYKNFEILAIDDGSTDKTFIKLREFASIDKRIKCAKEINSGRSVARNKGVHLSSGEYITFVDSDDYVNPKYLLHLVEGIRQGSDISMVNKLLVDSNDNPISNKIESSNVLINMTAEDGIKNVLRQNPDNEVWGKIFKRKLFENVKFPRGKIYEDLYVTFALMSKASKISFMNSPDYIYVQHVNNTINSDFSLKKMDILSMGEMAKKAVLNKYPNLKREVACRLFAAYSNVWMQIPENKYNIEYELFWKELKKNRSELLFRRIENKKVFFGVYFSLLGKRVYRYAYFLFKRR